MYKPPPPKQEQRYLEGRSSVRVSLTAGVGRSRPRAATGSHAAIAGHTAAPFRTRLILFNDGGPGIDRGGVLGRDVLDQEGVAGAAVGARSARIGDGRSTLQDGTLSAVNQAAYRLGLRVGSPALALAHAVADKA